MDSSAFFEMRRLGMYFDPNLDISVHYARREASLPLAESYEPAEVDEMPANYRAAVANFREALVSGVAIVFGSDSIAGTHGRNADEFVWRVIDGGQTPMNAIVSATSIAARSIGLSDEIGVIAVGRNADIVAVDGDLLADIRAVKRVMFVMRSGHVFRNF